MSYHRDEHWFDFDSDLIDIMYPMTDLDIKIAKYGAEAVLRNKKKKTQKKDKNVRRKQNNQDSVNDR
jgi:hypothetical protein